MAVNFKRYPNKKELDITKDKELIRSLCRKKYLQTRKQQIETNIPIISDYVGKLDRTTPKEMIRSLPADYQDLPLSYFFHPLIEDWIAESYKKKPCLSEDYNYTSNNGTSLMLESHFLIANQLEKNDIPYRYHAAVTLGDQTEYPTFTIKNPYDGEIFIWEHFGIDQSGTMQEINEKMRLYTEHGYTTSNKLIYTFEIDVNDPHHLQELIEEVIF